MEASGGVVVTDAGLHAPTADEEWTDMGETYVRACEYFGRKVEIAGEWTPEEEDTNTA